MNDISNEMKDIVNAPASAEELKLALSLIDLTSLEGTDNEQTTGELCKKAVRLGTTAVCVFPSLVSAAKRSLRNSTIRVASVAGAFPSGQLPLELRLKEAEYALSEGADEIDMVISRGKFLTGDHAAITTEIGAFKKVCGKKTLKVILETGELRSPENIRMASRIAIDAGADFLKTSTGKIPVHATPESVRIMLLAIKDSGKKIGIKPSGGISDGETAVKYLRLAEHILGKEWLQPGLFRFGASRLAEAIHTELYGKSKSHRKDINY